MKVQLGGRAVLVAAVVAAAAVLVVGFFAVLGVRSGVAGPGSAPPAAPLNPGHSYAHIELPDIGPWPGLNAEKVDGVEATSFWSVTGNTDTTPGTNFLGTTDNQDLELKVNNARALRLEYDFTSPNVIGGHSSNWLTSGVFGATIAGGGSVLGYPNRVTDHYGFVGGGRNNQAGDNAGTTADRFYASVGGGYGNAASGRYSTIGGGETNDADGDHATVGGGQDNAANGAYSTVAGGYWSSATGEEATVGGGDQNHASGDQATVSGGYNGNATAQSSTVIGGYQGYASGQYATVAGGYQNNAEGLYSFAAGRHAKAYNQGCFVWGDSTTYSDVACNDNNRFIVRASGGVYLYTNSTLTSGQYMAAGSSSWSTPSDRNLKENFTPVDGQEILARLAEMPVATWNYKAQDSSIRHMGPVAQDFYAAFGLGESDTAISAVDADGVAMAAIHGLHQIVQGLQAENADLKAQIGDLEARVTALEGGAGTSAASAELAFPGPSPWWLGLLGGLVVVGLVLAQRRLVGGRP